MPVENENIPKIAVDTSFGILVSLRMHFGLCNSAQSFQRYKDEVTHGIQFVFPYVENILLGSLSLKQHVALFCILFEQRSVLRIVFNMTKA